MPFKSPAQQRFMFAKHPDIAKRWVADAKAQGKPIIDPRTADLARQLKARNARKRST